MTEQEYKLATNSKDELQSKNEESKVAGDALENRALKYSEYVDIGLEDIDVKLQDSSELTKSPLKKSELVEEMTPLLKTLQKSEEGKVLEPKGDLRQQLKAISLPVLKKLTNEDKSRDIYFVLTRVPVLRYVACLFVATVTVQKLIF